MTKRNRPHSGKKHKGIELPEDRHLFMLRIFSCRDYIDEDAENVSMNTQSGDGQTRNAAAQAIIEITDRLAAAEEEATLLKKRLKETRSLTKVMTVMPHTACWVLGATYGHWTVTSLIRRGWVSTQGLLGIRVIPEVYCHEATQ